MMRKLTITLHDDGGFAIHEDGLLTGAAKTCAVIDLEQRFAQYWEWCQGQKVKP